MRTFSMFWIASIFAATVASAQVPPPPGGGGLGTPPTDTNPYNIHNWKRDLPLEGSHTHDGYGWYRDENGVIKQNPCNYTIVPAPSSLELVSLTSNTSLAARSAKSHSIANVKIRWQWIGVGIAPQKVWVRKKATAYASVAPNGTMTVSNGLGSPVKTEVESPHLTKTCTGTKLEEVTLSGNFLEVPFNLEATAESSNSTPTHGNQCHTSLSYEISLKSTAVGSSLGQTFRKGGTALNPVREQAPAGTFYTIGSDIYESIAPHGNQLVGFGLSPTFSAILYGYWGTDPYYEWTDGDSWWSDTLISEYQSITPRWRFPLSAINGMASGSPQKKIVKLKVTDTAPTEDPIPVPAECEVNVFTSVVNSKLKSLVANSWSYKAPEDFQTLSDDGYAYGGSGIACKWGETKSLWDVFELVGALEFTNPLVSRVIGLCGLAIEDFKPRPKNLTAPWAWGPEWPDSTYDGSLVAPPKPATWDFWKMAPSVKLIYVDANYECEKWDVQGYVGQKLSVGKLFTEFYRWSGAFYSSSYGGGIGGTGAGGGIGGVGGG